MNHSDLHLEVTMEHTADLVPYARNAKKHTTEQVEQICSSIKEFGFADPVGVWTNANGESEIVEGHGRVLAAQKLGIEEVPVIHLDALTDEQRRAYMLAHNQLTMSTGWDEVLLGEELSAIADSFDVSDFGFDAGLDDDAIADEFEEAAYEYTAAEVPFAKSLDEARNYVVLVFDTDIDWLHAKSVLGIKPARCYSTRKDGRISEGYEKLSTGRVIDGPEAIERLVRNAEMQAGVRCE